MRKAIFLSTLFLVFGIGIFLTTEQIFAENLSDKLKGKILLQVESKGEAWYVSPADGKRYSMGKPNDAFNLIRKIGIGISNDNLKKIQIADENLTGLDSDNDGLSDMAENSIGTDKNNKDSDGDGHDDKAEIMNGYNPKGTGKILINNNFAKQQAGKIFLQVESKGEAWYINPKNNQRVFLGRPADAFNLMRKLGSGISNKDLSKINVQTDITTVIKPIEAKKLINDLDVCDKMQDQNDADECYSKIATNKQNLSICDKMLRNNNNKSECYAGVAAAKQDLSICDKLDEFWKISCYSYFAKAKQDSSICGKIQSQNEKDECYYNVAINKQDFSVCDKIQDQITKIECYWSVAKAKQDLSFCDKIEKQFYRGVCYSGVAKAKQDLSICDKIENQWDKTEDQWRKGDCYLDIAVTKQDLSICDKIQNQDRKDMCYWEIAVIKHDLSICDKVQRQSQKEYCYVKAK